MKKPTSIFFTFFFFFFFFKQSFCSDPFYEACVPQHCGDGRNISYPFYINGLQNASCGYPGFDLRCSSNGIPVLRTSETDFLVRNISYKTSSVQLQNSSISCPSQITNVTFDPIRFVSGHDSTPNLVLISNCSGNLTGGLERYMIRSCEKSREVVMLENDRNLTRVTEVCGGGIRVVKTPVDVGGGVVVDGGNYADVMKNGFWLRWQVGECGHCESSGGRCGFNLTAFQFRCFCSDRPHRVSCKEKEKSKRRRWIIIAVVLGLAFAMVVGVAILMMCGIYKRKGKAFTYDNDKSQEQLEDASVYFGVPVFSYTELQDATHNFDTSKELGEGGFGTVYYGKLRDGREVAVKRLYEHNYKRVQQFMNEVEILTRLRHKHLVSLYGCTSRRSRELLLVYEYISNGTVAEHLHGERLESSPLTWSTRLKIAIETASALVYLHASEIIHRDVKTNNILLDHNFCVKVADFGLSRLLPNDMTHVSTAPQGTPGYVDPEYHQCYQLTDKSDVYSFGVVLIELISSMPAIDISRSRDEISLANMAINRIQRCALDELIDPFLRSDPDSERMATLVAELAFRCLQFDSESRPTMNEVLKVLKGIQGEESMEVGDHIGELKATNPQVPTPSPETENVKLLKGGITASPISVAAKWHSTSSGSTTP